MTPDAASSMTSVSRCALALPSRSRGRLAWAGLLSLAVLVAVGAFLRSRPQPVEPTVALADLLRLEGRLVLRNDTNRVFSGWIADYHAAGTLKSRSRVQQGVLNGLSEGWYTNGVRQIVEHFVDGFAEGPVSKWHATGARLSEGTARRGRLEGLFRRWHPDGTLIEEVTLREGQPHGLSRAWFPSGRLKAEVYLEDGKVVRQQFWDDREPPGLTAASRPENAR